MRMVMTVCIDYWSMMRSSLLTHQGVVAPYIPPGTMFYVSKQKSTLCIYSVLCL